MKKHGKSGKGRAARSGKRPHTARKVGGGIRKIGKKATSKKEKRSKSGPSKPSRAAGQSKQPMAPSQFKKAADEVPTLEQVMITCVNCGRPFKVLKLKGLSLEGTICQRCSLGEMELPESFG